MIRFFCGICRTEIPPTHEEPVCPKCDRWLGDLVLQLLSNRSKLGGRKRKGAQR